MTRLPAMDVTIRRAGPGDEETLARLNGMVQALHVGARPDVFVPVALEDIAAWFRDALARDTHRAWLADVDGSPAGYVLAVIHERPANPFSLARRWCEIDHLGVTEGMRGRGVAHALVKAAIEWARELGIATMSAQCWSFNVAAQGAFARLGFTPMLVRFERGLDEED